MRVFDASGPFHEKGKGIDKSKKAGEKRQAHGVSRDRVNESSFMKQLEAATEEQVKLSLDALVEEISKQADILAKHRTFGELDKYTKLVKNFMEEAIKKIYNVKVSDGSKLLEKRKKVYIMVQLVDKELEKLTKQILEKQAEGLELLATLDKIRGLLVDMYS